MYIYTDKTKCHIKPENCKAYETGSFDKIVGMSVKYLDQHSHGDIMSRMTNDVENISNTVSQSMSSLFSGVLTIIGTVIMMVALSPQLALCSCTTVILTIFATKNLSKAMRKFYSRRQVLLGQLNGTVEGDGHWYQDCYSI